jgi:hypothetical protein
MSHARTVALAVRGKFAEAWEILGVGEAGTSQTANPGSEAFQVVSTERGESWHKAIRPQSTSAV